MKFFFQTAVIILLAITSINQLINIISIDYNVEIEVKNIKTTKGCLILALFIDEESFKNEIPIKRIKYSKSNVKNDKTLIKLKLVKGIYGFSVLDDENNNGKMDYTILGFPLEGCGLSNFELSGFSRPSFDKFKVEILENAINNIVIKIKYY